MFHQLILSFFLNFSWNLCEFEATLLEKMLHSIRFLHGIYEKQLERILWLEFFIVKLKISFSTIFLLNKGEVLL